jgi:hypothetical protein
MLFNEVRIKRLEIKDYFNEYYYSSVGIYNDFKRYGLPWRVGYMEIPEYLKTIYDLFESVVEQHRAWKTKQMRSK